MAGILSRYRLNVKHQNGKISDDLTFKAIVNPFNTSKDGFLSNLASEIAILTPKP